MNGVTARAGEQGIRLSVELVPRTTWFINVRSLVPAAEWTRLKQHTFIAAGQRCEICGGRGRRWPVECHERWQYDEARAVQRLLGLIVLCPACHEVKHLGLAMQQGRGERALRHLAQVNGWDRTQTSQYVAFVFQQWEARSLIAWQVDMSWLQGSDRV